MRLLFALSLCAPLLAQAGNRSVYLDIHQASPSLEGHFNGVQDGQPIHFDLQGDLGIEKDKAKLGAAFEFQGPRFGVELSADEQDYKGFHHLNQDVTIDGKTFAANTDIASALSVKCYTFNWTIRFIKPRPYWIGMDLGVRAWALDLQADNHNQLVPISAQTSPTLPIPQIGLSAGFHAFEQRLVVKGYYHLLSRNGASYAHFGADARVFPFKWLGVRAFFDSESFKVPKGSIQDDLELQLDRKGAGFGLIVRL